MAFENNGRTWPIALAALLSIGSACSLLFCVGQGIVVGALIGLRGREADVASAQHVATYWMITAGICILASGAAASLSMPLFAEADRVPRFIARLLLGVLLAAGSSAVIAYLLVLLLNALHRNAVT